MKKKLFRVSTVAMSLNILLKGQLNYLNQYYDVTAICSGSPDLEELAEREQVKTKAIEICRNISPFSDLITLFKLYRYFKIEKPDIVHSIAPKAGLLCMIAAKAAGVPVRIHTFTGLIFPYKSGFLKEVLIFSDRIICLFATKIIPEGKGVKNDLIKYKITNKPLKVLSEGNVNGIDYHHFSIEQTTEDQKRNLKLALGIQECNFIFCFVGRLVKDKGINELVMAFKQLQQEFPQVKLLLVGPFEHRLDPLQKATLKEIGLNKHIVLTGFVKDVRPYFAISNALVFPSYREGFPNVLLQSLAMETPVIATDISGCNEIVEEDKNGILIKPKNSQQIYTAMKRLIEDEKLYDFFVKNSKSSILKYDYTKVWEAIIEEYEESLLSN